MSASGIVDIKAAKSQKFPRGYTFLFFIQILSTISFCFLYASLVLYATHALHFSDTKAMSLTATFVAFNYALHLLGGYIGGRLISFKGLFNIGMTLGIIGCLLLAKLSMFTMYWGLAFFLVSSGLNVTCINCLLTNLFAPDDPRREGAFLWNYSGMNFGFFIGYVVSGYLQLSESYTLLFELGALGNFCALLLMTFAWRNLPETTTSLASRTVLERRIFSVIGLFVIGLIVLIIHGVLQTAALSNQIILISGLAVGVYLMSAARNYKAQERSKIYAFILLALFSVVFWALYQMAPMALTLFIERNINRKFGGMTIPPQWVQNVNTFVIIFGGPLVNILLNHLRKKEIAFTNPTQFFLALFLIGVSFLVLPLGIYFSDALGYSSMFWIVMCLILQSVGELLISPIGYAMVGRLAPLELQGIMMGAWMMMTGIAAVFSSFFTVGEVNTVNPILTNPSYSQLFNQLGILAVLCAFVAFLLRSRLERMMGIESGGIIEEDEQEIVTAD